MKQKVKNKMIWVRPWMSDLLVLLKRGSILFLEMKRCKGKRWWANWTKVSEHQLKWQESINNITNAQYEVAYWSDEAIELIRTLELK